ncbi:hypothetical protein [Ureaplasma diversum]|uniref:hypothetical protein n=1 Tax=Ureaplasma diversum TaxID=42094 RepID=UPI000B110660|nr:hypothetical protein [Ureaplasma diversum]
MTKKKVVYSLIAGLVVGSVPASILIACSKEDSKPIQEPKKDQQTKQLNKSNDVNKEKIRQQIDAFIKLLQQVDLAKLSNDQRQQLKPKIDDLLKSENLSKLNDPSFLDSYYIKVIELQSFIKNQLHLDLEKLIKTTNNNNNNNNNNSKEDKDKKDKKDNTTNKTDKVNNPNQLNNENKENKQLESINKNQTTPESKPINKDNLKQQSNTNPNYVKLNATIKEIKDNIVKNKYGGNKAFAFYKILLTNNNIISDRYLLINKLINLIKKLVNERKQLMIVQV